MKEPIKNACPICGNSQSLYLHQIKEMMFGLDLCFDYIECGECDCLHLKEIPENLSSYYPPNYYSFSHQTLSRKQHNPLVRLRNAYAVYGKPWTGRFLMHLFPKPEVEWLNQIGLEKNTAVLDVGCGSGTLLHFLKDQGMTNLTGIDPFLHEDPASSKQLTLSKSDIFSINGTWDVIWFHHVFEHMDSPLAVLKKTASLLTPGGQCIIAIPTVSGDAWKTYGKDWVQIDAPRHLYLHSRKSMSILAEQSGLKICNIIYNSTGFQFWGSEQCKRRIPLMDKTTGHLTPRNKYFSEKQLSAFESKAKKLNKVGRGDQAIFYMRKNSD